MTKLDFYFSPTNPDQLEVEADNQALCSPVGIFELPSPSYFIQRLSSTYSKPHYLDIYRRKNKNTGELFSMSLAKYFGTNLKYAFSVTLPIEIHEPLNLTSIRILYKAFRKFQSDYPEFFL